MSWIHQNVRPPPPKNPQISAEIDRSKSVQQNLPQQADPYSAACFWVLIRIGVNRIGRMNGAQGIVHRLARLVRLILGDPSNVRRGEPGGATHRSRRLSPSPAFV